MWLEIITTMLVFNLGFACGCWWHADREERARQHTSYDDGGPWEN